MDPTWLTRIPQLSDEALLAYLRGRNRFKPEAVEAAALELARRGVSIPPGLLEAPAPAGSQGPGFLARARGPWRRPLRVSAGILLASGFGAALVIYRRAVADTAASFDAEPYTKSFQRQMEVMGGKANLMASDVRNGITGLFQGTRLAWTVFALCALCALVLWMPTLGKAPDRSPGGGA